jgi:hypothetical protein
LVLQNNAVDVDATAAADNDDIDYAELLKLLYNICM